MPDRIGQQLGNYRLLRLLGRGGFAEVYLAEQVYLKRRVALKVLHTSLEDEDVDQFLSEAQTLARLEHPNIVRVFEFAVEQGTPFLAMDYAPRGTLRKLHPRGSYLSLTTTVAYVKQVADALDYAHSQRVIHRDVKPENMLLGTDQQVLLSDFGISLLSPTSASLGTQNNAGTIPYMAPEQIRGKPVFGSDQYALGIVVYEWLCGVRPFEGPYWLVASQQELIAPPPLREKDPSLPEAIEAVVLRALAKEPEERYVSVQQFAQALEQASQISQVDLLSDGAGTAAPGNISPALSVTPTSSTKRVFVSASHADDAFVERLIGDLRQRGITATRENLGHTQDAPDPEDGVRQAIRAAESVCLVVSPNVRSSRSVKEHLCIATLYQRRLVFVWAAGDELADMLPGEGEQTVPVKLIDARAERYELALDELLACLEEESDRVEESLAEPAEEPRNPYKGLRAFTEDDAADFFGREALTQELIEQVKRLLAAEHREQLDRSKGRLLTVIGASGSGKSSVVMAGLLPRLQQGAVAGSEQWVYLSPMVPGTRALEALALTFTSWFPERSVKSIREDLEDESARGLHLLAAQLVKTPGQQVVLFIDQFEELFTLTGDEAERQQFIDVVVAAITEPHGAVIVLLTLRADFYDRPMAYPTLHQLIETHQKAVLPMAMVDLRAAIKGPAALPDVQLSFEGNLVGDLLFEVQGQVGALPLLQFTLEQLFERRSDRHLTLAAYRELGGLKGAISQHAERTYAALPSEEHRKLAHALFARLIDPGASEQDTTRRHAALSELVLADATRTRLLRETADAFIAARLLTTNEVAGTTTLEVSHEAVIREWRRLAQWIREAREDLHLLQVIRNDTAEWKRHERSPDRLYRGTQLAEALAWRERSLPSLDEEAFLEASVTEQEHQQALIAERQRQEAWQRKRYTRRTVLVGLAGLGLAVGAAATSRLLFSGNPSSLLPAPLTYQGHTGAVHSVAWSPDGKRLASASADKTVRVWDASSGQTLLTYQGHTKAVTSVAWSPDGKRIVSASADATVQVWDASSGQTLHTYRGHTKAVTSVAWSPDGKQIASASEDQVVQVWDANSGQTLHTYRGHTDAVESVAWSPDGKQIASASADATVQVWDASSGQIVRIYTGHTSAVVSVVWSPKGERLASASWDGTVQDGTVQVWNVDSNNGSRVLTYTGHTNAVHNVAWSPDGEWLASASADKTVQVWDANSGQTLHTYRGHSNIVDSVAWSPDGKQLASASADRTVQVWDANINDGSMVLTYTGHNNQVHSVAWSPDGKRIASASEDQTVQVWDANSGQTLHTYMEHTGAVESVAWSPDGKRLASASADGTVRVWDASSGQTLHTYRGHTDAVESVAWAPDGKRLASASVDRTVQVWDASSSHTVHTYSGHTNAVHSVAWSPDGKRLASASFDRTVQIWDPATGKLALTYQGHTNAVDSVVWSLDGTRIASASFDRTVRVWDPATGKLALTYQGHIDVVDSVAWSPDGRHLASASWDRTVRVWDASSGKTALTYRGHTNAVDSVAWSPNGKRLASTSAGTVQVWLWLKD